MFGNGPYKMEEARTEEEIILVKSDEWTGDDNQETWDDRLDSIEFRTIADPDTSYNAFEAGEGDNANIPPVGSLTPQDTYDNTLDVAILGSYHFVINTRNGPVAGDENLKLRQAISSAVNREEINEAVVQQHPHHVHRCHRRRASRASRPDLCEYCAYDASRRRRCSTSGRRRATRSPSPFPLQFNADAGHEPVAAIVVDNLAAIGIEAVAQPMNGETYFSDLG